MSKETREKIEECKRALNEAIINDMIDDRHRSENFPKIGSVIYVASSENISGGLVRIKSIDKYKMLVLDLAGINYSLNWEYIKHLQEEFSLRYSGQLAKYTD